MLLTVSAGIIGCKSTNQDAKVDTDTTVFLGINTVDYIENSYNESEKEEALHTYLCNKLEEEISKMTSVNSISIDAKTEESGLLKTPISVSLVFEKGCMNQESSEAILSMIASAFEITIENIDYEIKEM